MTTNCSDVTVTFNDGVVKVYRITAGPGIGSYLAREAGANGVLSLFNHEMSWGIPVASIRDWSITAAPEEQAEPRADGQYAREPIEPRRKRKHRQRDQEIPF